MQGGNIFYLEMHSLMEVGRTRFGLLRVLVVADLYLR